MKERIEQLLGQLNHGIYEKENELALSLLAAVAGESIILLGPPGVAKSMVARRLSEAFTGAHSFEYLMSRFSTPDEIFGPVSISKLKNSDDYERAVDGYLPTADVVFLDEIWKAGPAIQNTLLTVMNEKTFRNGRNMMHLPLKLLIAASNELPAQGEGLEALWDRFMIRLESKGIRHDDNFDRMLLDTGDADATVETRLKITQKEYDSWSHNINSVAVTSEVLKVIHQIRQSLRAVAIPGTDERRNVYVSDRRWKNIMRLMRASAYLQDRPAVSLADVLPVYNCLWQEPEERDAIRDMVIRSMFADFANQLNSMKQTLSEDIKKARAARAAGHIAVSKHHRDADKRVYEDFYYKLDDYKQSECYIVAHDYQQLPALGSGSVEGLLYPDKRNPAISFVRAYADSMAAPIGSTPVDLARDDDHVYIDGVRFTIETTRRSEPTLFDTSATADRDYYHDIDQLADTLQQVTGSIDAQLFVSTDDKEQVRNYLKELYRDMAFTRQDVDKLYS